MADEPLARTAAFDEKLVPIDIDLGHLLEASYHPMHRYFEEFLTGILFSAKERGKRVEVSLPYGDNAQVKFGDGMMTKTEQEANSDGKSLTPAYFFIRTHCVD